METTKEQEIAQLVFNVTRKANFTKNQVEGLMYVLSQSLEMYGCNLENYSIKRTAKGNFRVNTIDINGQIISKVNERQVEKLKGLK